MNEDQIEELNKWFADEERTYETRFDGEVYTVSIFDIEDFCDFLRDHTYDLIGIPCMVGTCGIHFTKDDLYEAKYY